MPFVNSRWLQSAGSRCERPLNSASVCVSTLHTDCSKTDPRCFYSKSSTVSARCVVMEADDVPPPPTTTAMKRKSYTAEFKLNVIEFAKVNTNRAAEKKFAISEKLVRDWRKAEDSLKAMNKNKRANRYMTPKWVKLEDRLREYIVHTQESGGHLSIRKICTEARVIANEMKIEGFTGGVSWYNRFMKRHSFTIRKPNQRKPEVALGSSDDQLQQPASADDFEENFYSFVETNIQTNSDSDSDIGCVYYEKK